MSLLRIRVLFGKEFKYAFKSYLFIFAVIAPIAFTLMVNLLFGSLFSGKPKLGVFDPGKSQFMESFSELETFDFQSFLSEPKSKNRKQRPATGKKARHSADVHLLNKN